MKKLTGIWGYFGVSSLHCSFDLLIPSILLLKICIPVWTHREVIFSFTLVIFFFLRIFFPVLTPRKIVRHNFPNGVQIAQYLSLGDKDKLGDWLPSVLAGLVGTCLDAVASNSLALMVASQVLGLDSGRGLCVESFSILVLVRVTRLLLVLP